MSNISRIALPFLALALAPVQLAAAPGDAPTAATPAARAPVVTFHKGDFGGKTIRYKATVEAIDVTAATNGAKASVVSFAYTREGADAATRPVLFLFNGGPIVASAYLHVGGLGPKRVSFPDDVKADPSTFRLIDNRYSPLDAVDLVFIDPASTGFSRVSGGSKESDFFSVRDDAAQFAAFIREWTARHGRTASPVYLFGESYGTHRAAELAGQLSDGPDARPPAGVFLYGQAVNIVETAQRPANVTSYVASLPTIAAIAWYHQKVPRGGKTVAQFIAEANDYAKGEYLSALYLGSALPEVRRVAVAERLEYFSGIPAKWYLDNELKITKERYRIELFKAEGLLLGLNDARYVEPITEKVGAEDPSRALGDAMMSNFLGYMRRDLKVSWDDDYVPIARVQGLGGWKWGASQTPFSDYPYHLGISRMMARNPAARVVVGNGYYDTQTTLGAAELLVHQAGWDPARTTLRFYDGGHMGYSIDAVARQIGEDIRAMVRR